VARVLRGPPCLHRFVVVLLKEAPNHPVQFRWQMPGEDVSGAKVDGGAVLAPNRHVWSLMLFEEVEPEGVTGDLRPPW
jgi:hypothetical protein